MSSASFLFPIHIDVGVFCPTAKDRLCWWTLPVVKPEALCCNQHIHGISETRVEQLPDRLLHGTLAESMQLSPAACWKNDVSASLRDNSYLRIFQDALATLSHRALLIYFNLEIPSTWKVGRRTTAYDVFKPIFSALQAQSV